MTHSSPAGTPAEPTTAVIIVDHGSRRQESNEMLLKAAVAFKATSCHTIVEPAHMEIAEPTIAEAFDRCVQQGARRVIVFPYFLSPGKHWKHDIPALVEAAATRHPGTEWLVTAPFGLHPQMQQIIADRIQHCLAAASGAGPASCDVCGDDPGCQVHASAPEVRGHA
jgi:sirohydrochlorin ferrochelatase